MIALATDPRRVPTGTSYEAEGTVPVPPNALAELGTAAYSAPRDPVPELGSRLQSIQTYRKMKKGDAAVRASLNVWKTPILGAEFYMEPYDATDVYMEHAEFCEFNLFHAGRPWLLVTQDILTAAENGYSVMEPVWEPREWSPRRKGANRRKYTTLKKIAPRPASTIKEFQYDDAGGPSGIVQLKLDKTGKVTEQEIPIEKLIIFTLNQEGGNLEGESVLRSAYTHWYYKHNLYKIDGIQKERHGIGVPEVELGPGHTERDRQAARELVRGLRTNEHAGIVKPPGMNIGFAKVEGQLVDILQSVDHHTQMIMLNVLAEFLILGVGGAGGGRATSGAQLDMFMKSLRFVANLICDYFNLYLIPRIVGYNFQTTEFPQLKVRNIGEARDLQALAAALSNLVRQRAITMDDDTEQYFRRVFDIPTKKVPRPNEVATPVGQNTNVETSGNNGKAPTDA